MHKVKVPTLTITLSLGLDSLLTSLVELFILGARLLALGPDLRQDINWIFVALHNRKTKT